MQGEVIDVFCKQRLLLLRKNTTDSSLWTADRLACTTGGEGKVGGNSSRVHLEEKKRRLAARGRGREEF
jgi:hypothetical protein